MEDSYSYWKGAAEDHDHVDGLRVPENDDGLGSPPPLTLEYRTVQPNMRRTKLNMIGISNPHPYTIVNAFGT